MGKPIKPSIERIIKSGHISKPRAPLIAPHLKGKLIFFRDWCKKCGICTVVCPNAVLVDGKDGYPTVSDEDKCNLCSLCWRICPDFAIVKNPELKNENNDNS